MKLTDFIPKKAIVLGMKAKDKRAAIEELVQAAKKGSGERFSVAAIVDAIVKRERMGSTGIGGGVGIPHAKLEGIKRLIGAFGVAQEPLDFAALDGEPVQVLFLILAPPSESEGYLQALKHIMAAIKRPNIVRFLKTAKSVKEVEGIFREVEEVPV
jgi:mannitol/fructose-specific phosphotransferase system IIA component (Ntr-type)